MAVRASSRSLKMTLVKTRSVTTVKAEVEVRLKSGNVDEIQCTALPSTISGWLSIGSSSGNVSSAEPVATILRDELGERFDAAASAAEFTRLAEAYRISPRQ